MPVPASINDLSTVAGSNSPPGSESPATLDDYLRAHASFIAQLRGGKLDASAVSTFMRTVLDDADQATALATLGANNASNLITGTLPDARISNSGVNTPTLLNGFSHGSGAGCRYWKIGGIVYVAIDATRSSNPGNGVNLFTLPVGYIPSLSVFSPGFYMIASPLSIGPMLFKIGTGGNVSIDIAASTAGTTYVASSLFSFPAA